MCVLEEQGVIRELRAHPEGKEELLDTVWLGQVQKIQPFMNGAFVEIRKGLTCFLSLSEQDFAYRPQDHGRRELKPGDAVLVQVSREASRRKNPCVTARVSFSGKYMVLSRGKGGVGISKKLTKRERERLRAIGAAFELPDRTELVIRTSARDVEEAALRKEFAALQRQMEELLHLADTRTVYSRLRTPEPFYLQMLGELSASHTALESIRTDDTEVYGRAEQYLEEKWPEKASCLSLYEDSLLPMYKLYRLEAVLEETLKEKVWLKSGGFLMIQQTEAFVSVDVNSGKFSGKKSPQETYRKINLEAAAEIVRQIRLRNLSGMILVDFINMEEEENREELLETLRCLTAADPVQTEVIDITALNIVEMTRKKMRKPLAEQDKDVKNEQQYDKSQVYE